MIYLDNAATTFIKPESVYRKIMYVVKKAGGNPGRGGHLMADRAQNEIFKTRVLACDFFNAKNPQCICFTNSYKFYVFFAGFSKLEKTSFRLMA